MGSSLLFAREGSKVRFLQSRESGELKIREGTGQVVRGEGNDSYIIIRVADNAVPAGRAWVRKWFPVDDPERATRCTVEGEKRVRLLLRCGTSHRQKQSEEERQQRLHGRPRLGKRTETP